ncbi:hypothetical protein BH23BAC2_BH23BAC2_25780 [soil metagenome]
MKILFTVFLFIVLAGCNRNKNLDPTMESVDTSVFSSPLNFPQQGVSLLPEAQNITNDWLAYLTAQSEIENFQSYTVKDVAQNATPIAEIMQSLRETAPRQMRTNAVTTRLSVLFTKAKVLEHQASMRKPDPLALKAAAEEIPVEFNNFKIQLNELYVKSIEDLEEELDAFNVEDTTSRTLRRNVPQLQDQN